MAVRTITFGKLNDIANRAISSVGDVSGKRFSIGRTTAGKI